MDAGRLEPVAGLVESARLDAPDLRDRLAEAFPLLSLSPADAAAMREFHGELAPLGMGWFGATVWHDTGVFAVSSDRPPVVSVDGCEPLAMTAVAGTPYWVALAPVEPGRLHLFRFGVNGDWAPPVDVAGYNSPSYDTGAPRGTLSERRTVASDVYPGATTEYWCYANPGIDERRGAPLMLWHDGAMCLAPWDLHALRLQVVSDNLAAAGLIPPMVHLLVSPSTGGEGAEFAPGVRYAETMRGIQYDTVSDRYGQHLIDEVIPDAGQLLKLRPDAYSRAAAGSSSGGLSAFKLAWFAPEQFSRVHSTIGTFTGIQWNPERGLEGGFMFPHWVRREPRRNIRVWLSDGANDLELDGRRGRDVFVAGSWPLNNIMLANALKGAGYDFQFRFGEGSHSTGQAALDLPESLAWLWRDYDSERNEQSFEQEAQEQARPVFRVRIANRDA